MSQIYMVGDTHFGIKPVHGFDKWTKVQFDYFYKQVIPYLKENVQEGDIMIHGGDLFDDRTFIPILTLNKVEELLIDLSKILPIHIILGNHDLWNKGDNSINSPKVLNWIPGVHIYENTTIIERDGKKLILMPWVEKKSDMIKEINNNDGDYLFCHSDLNGCRMHLSSVAHKNKNKIDVENFSKYKRVFSSHIHIRQINKNFEFIGSPYQMDRNDIHDKKGMTILNLETGKTNFISNEISPTFKNVHVKTEGDLMLLEHLNTNKHYVDLEINNSLLVGKRKNRFYLQNILGSKQFSSIEYINDLIKEERDEEEDLLNLELDVDNLQFDKFDQAILTYSEKKKYENKNIKDGVMDIMRDMLVIYHDQYKEKSDE